MERVVVTGVSSPVGRIVVDALRSRSLDVLAIDDIFAADLRDVFLAFNPDTVIHTAVSLTENVAENARFNVLGTLNVLEATRYSQARHFVFASTIAVEPKPTTLLAVAKLTGERYCTCYRTIHGLSSSVVRLDDGQSLQVQAQALLAAAQNPSLVAV